jgi:ADP-ribose pyrophosphatase YjhB (NUDIX family)
MGAHPRRAGGVSARAPGVGCGAAIVRDRTILLIKRLKPPEAGCWSLPGGKVDFLERIADAVVREIREEIGVSIALERLLGVVEMVGLDDQHWVSPIYLARLVAGEPRICEPTKHDGVAWYPLDRPPAPLSAAARDAFVALSGSA